MKKQIKKAQKGVTQTTKWASRRSDSYPVEKKVEYDTTGYSSGKKMFPAKFTSTYRSGEVKTATGRGDRASVDKAIKNPVVTEGVRTPAKTQTKSKSVPARTDMNVGLLDRITRATKAKEDLEGYRKAFRDNYDKKTPSSTPSSRSSSTSSSSSSSSPKQEKKIMRTKSAETLAPKREMPSRVSKPSGSGIQKGPAKRKYSDSQTKMMEIMQKGKQADGTMSESAQRKIQAVRAKERASNEKALRKSARASKFNARKIKKSGK